MFEQSFQFGGFSGVVGRANPRRAAVETAQYLHALTRLPAYEMLKDVSTTAGYAMAGPVGEFIEAARRIREFVGLTVRVEKQTKDGPEVTETVIPWPKATGTPAHIAAAFEFWLDNEELFTHLKGICDVLDRPNGTEGTPAEALTAAEKENPT